MATGFDDIGYYRNGGYSPQEAEYLASFPTQPRTYQEIQQALSTGSFTISNYLDTQAGRGGQTISHASTDTASGGGVGSRTGYTGPGSFFVRSRYGGSDTGGTGTGGGGASGYVRASATDRILQTGNRGVPANAGAADRSGAGSPGGPGAVLLRCL